MADGDHCGSTRRLGRQGHFRAGQAVQVPGGLALADCRGYEDWTEVAASHPQGNDPKRT